MIRRYKILAAIILFGVTFTSCDDVLINENPNGTLVEGLPPEVVLPGAQNETARVLMTRMNQVGNTMIATWSGNAQQIQAPFFVEFSHQIDPGFYNDIWDNLYLNVANFTNIVNYSGASNYDYYKASSKILRVFYMQYLVDLYGDVPYFGMHERGANLFPKYDSQEDIYRDFVEELDEAIKIINTTDASVAVPMGSSDIMLGGDMDMWKKFANTLKLRIFVRLTNLASQDGNIQSFIQSGFNGLLSAQFLGLNENITINPGYVDARDKMNPFAQAFGYLPGDFGGEPTTSNTTIGPTTFLVEYLDGTTNGIIDNRLARLYTPRGGQVSSQGNTHGGPGRPAALGLGLLSSASQDGYVMTSEESLLLQAEAVQRGYLSGDAKLLFQDAIRASFNRLGASGVETYLTASDNIQRIGWEGTTDKIEAIITQKWIALGGTNGAETWIEFNRTGYPNNMPLPTLTSQTTQPKRLLYPTSEYVGNTANVSVYSQQAPTTAFSTSIFWDVN